MYNPYERIEPRILFRGMILVGNLFEYADTYACFWTGTQVEIYRHEDLSLAVVAGCWANAGDLCFQTHAAPVRQGYFSCWRSALRFIIELRDQNGQLP